MLESIITVQFLNLTLSNVQNDLIVTLALVKVKSSIVTLPLTSTELALNIVS